MLEQGKGSYLGTVIEGKWWKPCFRGGLLCKAPGSWQLGEGGLYFLRLLTRKPLFFPFAAMRGLTVSRSHAGNFVFKPVVISLDWEKDGRLLNSGLVLDRDPGRTLLLAEQIRARIPQ